MLNLRKKGGDYNVLNELIRIKSTDPICIFGKEEDDGFKAKLIKAGFRTITLPGGHHYDNNFVALSKIIASDLK
jgi:type IV secretory pathway VirJ component